MDKNRIDKTIAIVGNGASVLKEKLGEKVDACDIVLRFNNFQLTKYQKYVGKRTDIWWGYNAPHPLLTTFKEVVFPWVGTLNLWRLYRSIEKACYTAGVPFKRVEVGLIDRAYRLLNLSVSGCTKPTIGFIALLWAKREYKTVKFLGFDGFKGGYRYYERGTFPRIMHAIEKELQIIELWEKTSENTFNHL